MKTLTKGKYVTKSGNTAIIVRLGHYIATGVIAVGNVYYFHHWYKDGKSSVSFAVDYNDIVL